MSKLRPAFHQDGTITAANASYMTDGATACIVARWERNSSFTINCN